MGKKAANKKESKLNRCLKAPFRALIKARDLYIDSMMVCAGKFGTPTAGDHVYVLPKSFSTASSRMTGDDDYIRDLIKTASTKSLKDKLELEMLQAQVLGPKDSTKGGDEVVPRTRSVAVIERIDENAPCDFGCDVKVNVDFVSRSRSHAIPRSRAGLI